MPASQQHEQRSLGHPKVAGANVSDLQAGKWVSVSTQETGAGWLTAASSDAGASGAPLPGIRYSGHAVHHRLSVKPCAAVESETSRLQVSELLCMAPMQHAAAPWHRLMWLLCCTML